MTRAGAAAYTVMGISPMELYMKIILIRAPKVISPIIKRIFGIV